MALTKRKKLARVVIVPAELVIKVSEDTEIWEGGATKGKMVAHSIDHRLIKCQDEGDLFSELTDLLMSSS